MAAFIPVPVFELVVFGASGDLALRKLYPSLFHRFCDGQVEPGSRIIGVARHELSREEFLQNVTNGFVNLAGGDANDPKFKEFLEILDYVAIDATNENADWSAMKALLSDCLLYTSRCV